MTNETKTYIGIDAGKDELAIPHSANPLCVHDVDVLRQPTERISIPTEK